MTNKFIDGVWRVVSWKWGCVMQRDLKIGISLCVLMFGVVGAFMFRREQPAPKSQTLQLKTARQLDQKIAQRSRTPYMTGMTGEIEHDEDEDDSFADPQDGSRPAHLLPPNHLLEEEDGILAPHSDAGHRGHRTRESAPGTTRPRNGGVPRVVAEGVTPGLQTHTIQPGDTLSSLAGKYLGSQNRFQEIFDHNRNVLTSPDRLPEGVVLSIPAATPETRRTTTVSRTQSPVTHEVLRPTGDLDSIEPISPDDAGDAEYPRSVSIESDGANVPEPPLPGNHSEPGSETKSGETKASDLKRKFIAPSRLPFSHSAARTSASRKATDSKSDGTKISTDIQAPDPAHEDSGVKQTYVVRKGDSLERISQKIYGNSRRATDIYNANRSKLARPDAVREGLELELP